LNLSRNEVALRQCQCKEWKPTRTVTSQVATEQQFELRENNSMLITLKPQK
jgi:hypothetical protein